MLPSFEEAQKAGSIVAYFPAWEHLPKNRHECVLQILFASALDSAGLSELIHDPIRAVKPVPIEKVYNETAITPASRLVLEELGFRATVLPPSSDKAIYCVADTVFKSTAITKRPGLALLAIGKYAATEIEIWDCLDRGADAVSAGTAEITSHTQWLEALLNTGLAWEPLPIGGSNEN